MKAAMVQACVTAVWLLAWCGLGQATTHPAHHSVLLSVRTSLVSNGGQIIDGRVAVPLLECGYLFCESPDAFTNDTTHFWDYYVYWEMPEQAARDPGVFVLGNGFQMPRSYLVFKGFTANFTGEYRCVLNFRSSPLAALTVAVSLDLAPPSRPCTNTSP